MSNEREGTLIAPVGGDYCQFSKGERVKVRSNHNGLCSVERAVWKNSLTISNVLTGVPEWKVCLEEEQTSCSQRAAKVCPEIYVFSARG